ncbi:MAG: hypothetical protein NDJ18_07105 [candidate division Zixibacteria bacterium]|nr:hypothetical protein [candidate division Zixibacteria bacterium]
MRSIAIRPIILSVLLLAVCASSPPLAAERADYQGFALPYPMELPAPLASDSLYIGYVQPLNNLTLTIDDSGRVSGFRTELMVTSRWRGALRTYLDRLRFEPCIQQGKTATCQIPGRFLVSRVDSSVALELPLDSQGRIKDPTLYTKGLRLNGIKLPSVEKFPWYHAAFPAADSNRVLRFCLAKVAFDGKGRATAIARVSSDLASFDDQLLTAISYAKFNSGLMPDSTPIRSGYLLITLFPTTRYPTLPWSRQRVDSLDLHDRLAIRMVPDTQSVMIPPLPLSRTEIVIGAGLPVQFRSAPLAVKIRINEDGRSRVSVDAGNQAGLYALAMTLENQLRFYPAVGFDGKRIEYDGWLLIRSEGESTVRISFVWLLEPNLGDAGK